MRASRKKYLRKRRSLEENTDISVGYLIYLQEQSEFCPFCGKKMIDTDHFYHPDQRQLDHIIPLSIGGKHLKNNIRYLCGSCNNHRPRKGQDLKPEYLMKN